MNCNGNFKSISHLRERAAAAFEAQRDVPARAVRLAARLAGVVDKEASLGDRKGAHPAPRCGVPAQRHHRVAGLRRPPRHQRFDVVERHRAPLRGAFRVQRAPKVGGRRGSVGKRAEVPLQRSEEHLPPDEGSEHPEQRGALGIRDRVEDRPNLARVVDLDLDWVRRAQRIETQRVAHDAGELGVPHVPLRLDLLERDKLHEASEALL